MGAIDGKAHFLFVWLCCVSCKLWIPYYLQLFINWRAKWALLWSGRDQINNPAIFFSTEGILVWFHYRYRKKIPFHMLFKWNGTWSVLVSCIISPKGNIFATIGQNVLMNHNYVYSSTYFLSIKIHFTEMRFNQNFLFIVIFVFVKVWHKWYDIFVIRNSDTLHMFLSHISIAA